MAKEKPHPVILICMNCVIMRKAFYAVLKDLGNKFNTVPFNCPVARNLTRFCSDGLIKEEIHWLHHEVNFVRIQV